MFRCNFNVLLVDTMRATTSVFTTKEHPRVRMILARGWFVASSIRFYNNDNHTMYGNLQFSGNCKKTRKLILPKCLCLCVCVWNCNSNVLLVDSMHATISQFTKTKSPACSKFVGAKLFRCRRYEIAK